jgi:hypothetical protein
LVGVGVEVGVRVVSGVRVSEGAMCGAICGGVVDTVIEMDWEVRGTWLTQAPGRAARARKVNANPMLRCMTTPRGVRGRPTASS